MRGLVASAQSKDQQGEGQPDVAGARFCHKSAKAHRDALKCWHLIRPLSGVTSVVYSPCGSEVAFGPEANSADISLDPKGVATVVVAPPTQRQVSSSIERRQTVFPLGQDLAAARK